MTTPQSYITPREVRDRMRAGARDVLADLLNLKTGEDPEESDTLATAIDDANQTIYAHIATRYDQPFDEVPGVLKAAALDLVRFLIVSRCRPEMDSTGAYERAHDRALKTLMKVKEGEIILTFPPQGQVQQLVNTRKISVGTSNDTDAQTEFRRNIGRF